MCEQKRSRRGVYYDLSISPYEFTTPYGDCFKFSSQKKLDIFTRDIDREIKRTNRFLEHNRLNTFLPDEIIQLMWKAVYRAFYIKVEG